MYAPKFILTPAQMRNAEQCAVIHGTGLDVLMDNAGEVLGRAILTAAQKRMGHRIVILAGAGNNAGDGFVAARFLGEAGIQTSVILCCGEPRTELARASFEKAQRFADFFEASDPAVFELIADADVIADCVFGTGFHGEIEDAAAEIISAANSSEAYRIACDVPSGVDSLSGQTSAVVFSADETITFHAPKLGMYLAPAKYCCGRIICADIGVPQKAEEYADIHIVKAEKSNIPGRLPLRPENGHKGTFGRVTLVCGSAMYPGAAIISSTAALRSGVGIVNLCAPEKIISAALPRIPECTFTEMKADGEGFISLDNFDKIMERLETSQAAVIGCGLGITEDAVRLVRKIVQNAKCTLIIDADGINCLSQHIDVLKEKQAEIILTPHMGELARLCDTDIKYVLSDPLGYAESIADRYGVTVHAKSAQTITIGGKRCEITDFGCSALAKGGSGDMLAGLIGSLTAQGLDPFSACTAADWIMGASARRLCGSRSARSVTATDIIGEFGRTLLCAESQM